MRRLTNPDKNGKIGRLGWTIDVEEQAVLVSRARVEAIDLRESKGAGLRADGGLINSRDNGIGCCRSLGSLPSKFANRRCSIADPVLSASVEGSPIVSCREKVCGVATTHPLKMFKS